MTRCERSVPGLRAISSATVAAELAGAAFDGLPAGIGRSDLMRAIEKGGARCGLSRTEVRRLVYLVRHTAEIDWHHENSMPVVWVSVSKMALDFNVTRRRINAVERTLAETGWISHRDSGSRYRWGERDAESGWVRHACGVDLRSLGARYAELADAARAAEEEWWLRKEVRAAASSLRSEIRRLALALGLSEADALAVGRGFPEGAALDDLVRDRDRLAALRDGLFREFRSVHDAPGTELEVSVPASRTAVAEAAGEDRQEFSGGGGETKSSPSGPKSSPSGDEKFPSILIHTESTETVVGNRHTGPADDVEDHCEAAVDAGGGRCKGDNGLGRKQLAGGVDCGERHLQPGRVADAASGRFRELAGSDPGWRALRYAAEVRRAEMCIHDRAWYLAVRTLGGRAAAVLVAVIDGRCEEKAGFVWNPAGFVVACARLARTGDLHLHKSVWGLEVRRRRREAWSPYEDPRWRAVEARWAAWSAAAAAG